MGEAGETWRWRDRAPAPSPEAREGLEATLRRTLGDLALEVGQALILDAERAEGMGRVAIVPLEAAAVGVQEAAAQRGRAT